MKEAKADEKSVNKIELLILQFLQWYEPQHAYEIDKLVERMHARKWMDIGFSTIYTALKRLEKKGFVKSERVSQKNKPTKIMYKKTKDGDEILRNEVAKLITEFEIPKLQINQAMLSFHIFSKEQIEELMQQRLKSFDEAKEMAHEEHEKLRCGDEICSDNPMFEWVTGHSMELGDFEYKWTEKWIDCLKGLDWKKDVVEKLTQKNGKGSV